jgi:chemotaxis protein CheZ
MVQIVQREDWEELILILREVEEGIETAEGGAATSIECGSVCQALRELHATAAMLELKDLEEIAQCLETQLTQEIASGGGREAIETFKSGLRSLLAEMGHTARNGGNGLDLEEVYRILQVRSPNDTKMQSEYWDLPGVSQLRQLATGMGGDLTIENNGADGTTLHLRLQAKPEYLMRMEALLSSGMMPSLWTGDMPEIDHRLEKVLNTMREFMQAMSSGDMRRSQEILLHLAEQQDQAGLYNEIGLMARELHNSLKHFMETLDPVLKEMVESRLPDSGNRLEHILELTEKAANITLDHVEAMQKRNSEDQLGLAQVEALLMGLQAIGDQAERQMAQGLEISKRLRSSLRQTHEDLITVLTAQDYQDLTGQIIQKIMTLLKELELKLVNVIRVFGVKPEQCKGEHHEELYGPACKSKVEALHSQDDVDALLAQFGF